MFLGKNKKKEIWIKDAFHRRLTYNVGCGRILGNGKYPKSKLLQKIEAGDRKFHKEYLEFCKYKGKKIASIQRRRYTELRLLYYK